MGLLETLFDRMSTPLTAIRRRRHHLAHADGDMEVRSRQDCRQRWCHAHAVCPHLARSRDRALRVDQRKV